MGFAKVMDWLRSGLLAMILLGVVASALAEPAAPLPSELEAAPVYLHYRKVATLRASMLGLTPAERAERAEAELTRLSARGGPREVTRRAIPQGQVLLVDGVMAFVLLEGDAAPGESIEETTDRVVSQVRSVLASVRDSGGLPEMLQGLALAVTISLVAVFLLWLLRRSRSWVAVKLARAASEKAESLTIGGEAVVQRERVIGMVRKVVTTSYWLAVLLVVYEWLSIGLELFPYTRAWGDGLHGFLLGILGQVFWGIASGIPNLLVAFLNSFNLLFAFLVVSGALANVIVPVGANETAMALASLLQSLSTPGTAGNILLGWLPLIFSTLFFLIPAVRWFRIQKARKQRTINNMRKRLYRVIFANRGRAESAEAVAQAINGNAREHQVPKETVEKLLSNLALDMPGDTSVSDDGKVVYAFPRVADELKEVEVLRAGRRLDTGLGKVIVDSD